jgi:radical SAM superfamily enzyme YgiQ (UPF0313 family)
MTQTLVFEETKTQDLKIGLISFNWEVDGSLALDNLIGYANENEKIRNNVKFEQFCKIMPKDFANQENTEFQIYSWALKNKFQIIGFSCYVWNIDFVNRLAKNLKVLLSDVVIMYGGGQIRGNYVNYLFNNEKCVDICFEGEGELTFQKVILSCIDKSGLEDIKGISFLNKNGEIVNTGKADIVSDMNEIPSPYIGKELEKGGAYLLETFRGCPYRCSYCIWGELGSIREYTMERVEEELITVLRSQPSHIMFTDATFNMKKVRAKRIISIIIEELKSGRVKPFSGLFENKLEIIDQEYADLLDELMNLNPLFTFEFGLQSSSSEASKLMRRPFSTQRYLKAWDLFSDKLQSMAIIDCIYGLPGDDIANFKDTVDFAYALKPHSIQCFRLSILPGSQYEEEAKLHEIIYEDIPPHMVFQTKWVNFDEMMELQAFSYCITDLYHFHKHTIRIVLDLLNEEKISNLISHFCSWYGTSNILLQLGESRPEGRWRQLDLSQAFLDFILFKTKGLINDAQKNKIVAVLEYEKALGDVAMKRKKVKKVDVTNLVSNATLLESDYNILSFVKQRNSTISDLESKKTYMVFTSDIIHADISIPISYNINNNHYDILNKFSIENKKEKFKDDFDFDSEKYYKYISQLEKLKILE